MIFDKAAWEKYVKGYTFHSICILDKNTFFFTLKEKIMYNRGKTRFMFTKTDGSGQRFYACQVDENFANASVALATSVPEFICVDAQRRVFSFGPKQSLFEEPIKNRLSSNRSNPTITRTVGVSGHVYAIGRPMRIYRREGVDNWSHHNNRVALTALERHKEDAFHDLDGFSPHNMYAVGDSGALWHYDGDNWRVQDFPTTLNLRTVVCANDGNIYITDSEGSIWYRKNGHWQICVKGEGVGFRDSVWFAGYLWCAADFELCILESNRLIPAQQAIHQPMPESLQRFCSRLSVSPDGHYLLVGNDDGLVRYDGTAWDILYDSSAYDHVTRRKFICGGQDKKFWQVETNGYDMTVRFGKVGRKGRTQQKRFASTELCDREAARLITERKEHGYIESHLLTLKEASKIYEIDPLFTDAGNHCAMSPDDLVYVLDGSISLNQLTSEISDSEAALLVINGDLSIQGDIHLNKEQTTQTPARLMVLGDVTATNLCCTTQQIVVRDNLNLSGYLYCPATQNKNGILAVRGQTTAACIVQVSPDTPYLSLNPASDTEYFSGDTLAQYRDKMPFFQHNLFDIDGFISFLKGSHPTARQPLTFSGSLQLLDGLSAQQQYPELVLPKNIQLTNRWVLVCNGDVSLDNHFSLDWEVADTGGWLRALNIASSSNGVAGMLINGNFTVNGVIANNDTIGPFLCVMGNLNAHNIVSGGTLLHVDGDITVDHTIIGFDNGLLSCNGSLNAGYLVICDHRLSIKGGINAITIDENGDTLPDADYTGKDDILRVVSSQVFSGQKISRSRIISRLHAGKPLIRKGITPARLTVARILAEHQTTDNRLTELDLSNKGLQEFPKTILDLCGLKSLKLNNNAISTIPESICRLTELETLEINECQLTALPESIGSLSKLRRLSLTGNKLQRLPSSLTELTQLEVLHIGNNSTPLPDDIGALSQLKELDAHGNKRLLPLPASMEQLTRLETLSLAGCLGNNSTLIEFPQIITRLTSLQSLNLSSNSLNDLPDTITRLNNLTHLNLNSTLRGIQHLPDLSVMQHLRVLHFNGQRQYTSSQPPQHDLLLSLLNNPPPGLQQLTIDHWGKEDGIYQNGRYTKGLYRPNLSELPDTFGKLPDLRILHMRLNGLETLPPSLFALKALEELDIYGNKISYQQIQTLRETFPAIRLEAFNNVSEQDSEAYYQSRRMIRDANRLLASHDYQNALNDYSQTIAHYKDCGIYAEYDLFYAYYGKQYALSRILERKQCTLPIEEQTRIYQDCVEMALSKPIWLDSEQGKLQLVMQQDGYTGLARCLMKDSPTVEQLDQALKYAEHACATSQDYCAAHECKVRILLALHRPNEAYALLTQILTTDDEFTGLSDLRSSDDYKQWLMAKRQAVTA